MNKINIDENNKLNTEEILKDKACKIGIMGGSFDPCHKGHIALAFDVVRRLSFDKVILVPTFIQPFKQEVKAMPAEDRLKILQLSIESELNFSKGDALEDSSTKSLEKINGKLEISDYEINKGEISYTYDTLMHFKENLYSDCEIYFICGSDSILHIDRWYKAEKILDKFGVVVGRRPGDVEEKQIKDKIEQLRRDYNANILEVANNLYDISSTEIRKCLKEGLPIDEYVYESVEEYILNNGLYV